MDTIQELDKRLFTQTQYGKILKPDADVTNLTYEQVTALVAFNSGIDLPFMMTFSPEASMFMQMFIDWG